MPKYVIEKEIPGGGKFTTEELRAIAQTSCGVVNKMGPQMQWIQNYITPDKIYCMYRASNKEIILEHPRQNGFPPVVSEVSTIIDPTMAG
jgi:hypothetical protein